MKSKITLLALAASVVAGLGEKVNAAVFDHMTRHGMVLGAAPKDKNQQAGQQDAQKAAEREAQIEMDRTLKEIEDNPNLSDEERARQIEQTKGTPGTPLGAGRAYETAASGSANVNGKASATRAGGDPVNSPVIGNPGESNPAAGNYDYALAAAAGNPNARSQALASTAVAGGPGSTGRKQDDFKHPVRVRAIRKGEYNGVKEVGEEFDNTRNLAPFPEDDKSWFTPIDEGERATAEQRGVERREAEEAKRVQEDQERAAIAKLGSGRRA